MAEAGRSVIRSASDETLASCFDNQSPQALIAMLYRLDFARHDHRRTGAEYANLADACYACREAIKSLA